MDKKNTGNFGEKIATKFLLEKGYIFLEKNFRSKFGEIDLIFKNGNDVIFVEVKTRSSDLFGEGFESIDKKKIGKLTKVGEYFCLKNNINFESCRFDIVSILLKKSGDFCKIKHFIKVI